MTRYGRFLLCLPLCLGSLLACAGAEDTTPVLALDTRTACDDGSACLNADVETYALDGIRVIHKRLPGHPLVAVRVLFDAGSVSGKQLWSEDLALSLLRQGGPRRFTPPSWNAELLRLSATLTAFRGVDYGVVSLLAPLPNWRPVWDLLAEAFYDPNLSGYELDYLRQNVLRAFTSERDDPGTAAGIDAWTRLLQGELQNQPRESLDALAAVSLADVGAAWRALLTPDRMLIAVVGDVERSAVEAAVRSAARAFHAQVPAEFPAPVTPQVVPQREIAVLPYPDAPTWYIASYFKGPPADSPDYAPLTLGVAVLGRRLFQEVREARGLAYSTGSELLFYRSTVGALWLTSQAPREALPIARQVLAELASLGPGESELAAARASLRTSLLSATDSPDNLAYTLSDWEFTVGRHESVDEYLDALDRAQPAQVAAALDAYVRGVKIAAAGGGSELTEADLSTLFVRP